MKCCSMTDCLFSLCTSLGLIFSNIHTCTFTCTYLFTNQCRPYKVYIVTQSKYLHVKFKHTYEIYIDLYVISFNVFVHGAALSFFFPWPVFPVGICQKIVIIMTVTITARFSFSSFLSPPLYKQLKKFSHERHFIYTQSLKDEFHNNRM